MNLTTILIALEDEAPKTIANLLYAAVIVLGGVIAYMYFSNRNEIKEKDKAIMKVMEEHRNDIKEGNKDYKSVVDKFSQFMSQIEGIVNARK